MLIYFYYSCRQLENEMNDTIENRGFGGGDNRIPVAVKPRVHQKAWI